MLIFYTLFITVFLGKEKTNSEMIWNLRIYMKITDLYILLMILTCCLAILAVLIIILYCKTLKYIKKHSKICKQETSALESTNSDSDILSEETAVHTNILPPHKDNLFGLSTTQPTVEVDIIQVANAAIDALNPFAEAQNIKIHLSTTCEELMVMAVPESIRILFCNIIDNSIKYMGRAGHMIITISLLGDDIFVILKDTGKGLNEDETPHIFELNFQGSNRVSGNGLGLTQSKMIVEAFGGTIYAKSSPEKGMAIYIQLPVSKEEC